MTRHKHADLIHAWADGAEIQVKYLDGSWVDELYPCFYPNNEYRIKPKIVKREGWVNIYRQPSIEYPEVLCCVHPTEKVAKGMASVEVIATVKVEWEEKE